jgi:23S rRNA (guanosine2251-2'-O)-methyltransferase
MSQSRILHGFHAVAARIRHDAKTVREVYVEASRKDKRMQDFIKDAEAAGLRVIPVDVKRLDGMAGNALTHSLDDLLDALEAEKKTPLLLILDQITDPHNLGACLRVADGAGAHAVVAPKDRACGLNATAAKVASGAAESVPYITVTNLARTIRELQERGVRVIGTADETATSIYAADLTGPLALILGAEGEGMRRLTRETCDQLVRIPMAGSVESLNVSVASAVCLYEAMRQRAVP